ncbi:hypothetical protein Salat_0835100, partial [Sesamum alatum]
MFKTLVNKPVAAETAFNSAIAGIRGDNSGVSVDKVFTVKTVTTNVTNAGTNCNVVPVINYAMTENMPTSLISSNSVPKTTLSAKVVASNIAEIYVNNVVAVENISTVNTVTPNVIETATSGK